MWEFLVGLASLIGLPRLIGLFWPPKDCTPPKIHRYHMAVSSALLIYLIAFVVIVALAWNFIPGVSFGFAKAATIDVRVGKLEDRVTKTEQRIGDLELINVEQELFSLRERECKAPMGGKDVFTRQLARLMAVYQRNNNGSQYRLPDCDEF